MPEDNQPGAGGTNPDAGGEGDKQPTPEQTVTRKAYDKAVDQKKARDEQIRELQAKVSEFETKDKEKEESDLKAKEEWKKFGELKEKELAEHKAETSQLKQTLEEGVKLDAFLKNVNGAVEDQYLALVDLSAIVLDPTTRRPDIASVQKAARDFEKKFGKILSASGGANLPNDAAKKKGETLSVDAWKDLDVDKMKENLAEMVKQRNAKQA